MVWLVFPSAATRGLKSLNLTLAPVTQWWRAPEPSGLAMSFYSGGGEPHCSSPGR